MNISARTRILVIVMVLVVDLLFFTLSRTLFSEIFNIVLERLPWEDTTEKAILVMGGLILAVVCSIYIIRTLIELFKKSV